MDPILIAQLLATFGPPAIDLINTLIQKLQTKGVVTPEEWATLATALQQTAADRMKAQLVAAGISLDDPKAVALLQLANG